MQITQTILEQLGGNRFVAMTGARDLVAGTNSLQFGFGRGANNKANKARITLETSDTYMIEFWSLRGLNLKSCGEPVRGVYADHLPAVFTEQTGLDTHL